MPFIQHFDDAVTSGEIGGKGAALRRLRKAGFPVPNGFCVDTDAYLDFVQSNRLAAALAATLKLPELHLPAAAHDAAARLAPLLTNATLPSAVAWSVRVAYRNLRARTGPDLMVAVRSSAQAEDGAGASAAGQYESFLQIEGDDGVIEAILGCYRSLWSERAIQYRALQGLNDQEAMAVVVMEMVQAEVAGVTFTVNPIRLHANEMMINASWGLGEMVVSGRITPDSAIVDRTSLRILAYEIGEKDLEVLAEPSGAGGTIMRAVPPDRAWRRALDDEAMQRLATVCRAIEEFDGRPQDIEWAFARDQLFVLQARPITALGR